MTPSILDDPQHWRERAVEARRVADKLDDPIAKAAMLRIASDYGQIAEQAQLRAAGAGRSRSASDEDDSAHPQTRQRLPVGRSKDWLKFKNPGAPALKRGGRGGVGTVKSRLVHWLVYTIVAGVLSLAALEVGIRLYVQAPILGFQDWRGANATALESGGRYDEVLGWFQPANHFSDGFNTIEYGIRKNSSRNEPLSQGGVLAVGDSYTVGSQVKDEESWPAQVERRAQVRVINAGVGGYGVDQIVLTAERLLPVVSPQMVIVGIYQETIVRANYKSYGAPKPYFIFEDGEWRHKNRPVPRLVASHGQEPLYRVAMAHLLSVHIFMQRFFFDWWFSNGRAVYEAASEVSGKSSCYLLERLQQRIAAEHIPAMIVVQYPGHSYIRRRPRPDYVEDVLRCARELGYEVVDERDPMSAIARQSIASLQEHYVMSPEGGYGHMSARGNQLIASLIADRLFRLGDRATIARPVP